MLMAAGILSIAAAFCWFVDKWFDNANIDLTWLVRILIFAVMILIALNFYLQSKGSLI